jgi:hypothetical protein
MTNIPDKLPTWQEKKELLYDRSATPDPEALVTMGDEYVKAGRRTDALEFYHRAGHAAKIASLRQGAVDAGDFFLYERCADLAGPPRDDEEVSTLAGNAESAEKFSYAWRAYQYLRDDEAAARARDKLRDILPHAELIFHEDDDS